MCPYAVIDLLLHKTAFNKLTLVKLYWLFLKVSGNHFVYDHGLKIELPTNTSYTYSKHKNMHIDSLVTELARLKGRRLALCL